MFCRILSRLWIIGFFAVLLLTTAPGAQANTCGTWSNPPTTGDNVKNQGTGTTYPTIAAAVAAASSGDTLEVLVSSLEVGPVTLPASLSSLTLTSSSSLSNPATLYAAFDTCGSGSARGWFVVASGVDLTVSDLKFNGGSHQIYQAFRHQGTGSFNSVDFTSIQYPNYQGTAIAVFGSGASVNVSHSNFTNIGRAGILYYGSGVTGTVNGMSYTGKGAGDYLDYGIDIEHGAVVTVENSTFTDCLGSGSEGTSAAIQVSTFNNGAGTAATLTGNTIKNNAIGVAAGYYGYKGDTSTVTATGNTISGNTHVGIQANTQQPIVATGNHWGCSQGPGYTGCDSLGGPYAFQVQTGFSASVTWTPASFGFQIGHAYLITATLDPAPEDGAQATFLSPGNALSNPSATVKDGKVATTLVLGSRNPYLFIFNLEFEGKKYPHLATASKSTSSIFKIQRKEAITNGNFTMEVSGAPANATVYLYGSLNQGYSEEATTGCGVGLDNAQLIGTETVAADGTQPTFSVSMPAGWKDKIGNFQAILSSPHCQVSNWQPVFYPNDV